MQGRRQLSMAAWARIKSCSVTIPTVSPVSLATTTTMLEGDSINLLPTSRTVWSGWHVNAEPLSSHYSKAAAHAALMKIVRGR